MTTTSSNKENGRTHKSKRRSVSNAASPSDEQPNGNLNGTDPSGTSSGGRGTKRVRDGSEEPVEEKRPRSLKKGPKLVDESDMAVDGEGDGDEDGGDTRCVCGKGDSDEGGLMVMCETCKVWQHTQCMDISEDDVPENYFCEQCMPSLHIELLKRLSKTVKRPRRRSSATRTMQKQLSSSPSPPATIQKTLGKRRNTMNSRATTYEEDVAAAIHASKIDVPENEEEDDTPIVFVGPRKRRKRSLAASVPEPESIPSAKRSRSASVTSEQPAPIEHATPNPETLEVPEQPVPEPSDEEAPPAPPPPRGKRGGAPRKNVRKNASPSVLDDNEDAPSRASGRGRQPNQYSSSRRGGHSTNTKRAAGHNGVQETNKRFGNNNNKSTRPASPPPFLTTWSLPDHLSHIQQILPSEIPEPLDIRTTFTVETTQERGVKVKWPTKRMTVADMNKRVRNMLEYVTREQSQHEERQARTDALNEAISERRYKRLSPEPSDLMDVDAMQLTIEEDVKPTMDKDGQMVDSRVFEFESTSPVPSSEASNDNVTVSWMKMETDEMLADLVSGLLAFQERYRPRNRRQTGTALLVV